MGKPRVQTWSYSGTNIDQLYMTIGMLGQLAPKSLVAGSEFQGNIGHLEVTMDVNGKWQAIELRDDNVEPPTKLKLERLGITVAKLA